MNDKITVEWAKVYIAGILCGTTFVLSFVAATVFEQVYIVKKCTEAGLHQEVSGSQVIWTARRFELQPQPQVEHHGQPVIVTNVNGRSTTVYSDGSVTTSPPP